ncbi:cytochrome P450 [Lichtheimia hyalospora FSU 10163]|nr:cytochrome P450 [Lichtheimia hyalospora FSU 10163]
MSFIASNNQFINVDGALEKNSYKLTNDDLRHLILKHLKDNIDIYLARVQKQCLQVLKHKVGDHPVTLAGLYPLARGLTANTTGTVFGGSSMLSNDTLMDNFEYTADETLKDVIRAAPYTMFLPGLRYLYRVILQPKFGGIKRRLKVIKSAVKPEVEQRLQALRNNNTVYREQDVMNYIIETHLLDQEDTIVTNSISNWFVVMSFLSVLTTSGALGNVLEYLAEYPEYVDELLDEQNQVIPQDQMGVTSAEQKKLIKLDSFIREVFRITTKNFGHPHTNIGKQDVVLSNGTVIHPGEEVYINLWHVNFDPSMQQGVEDVDVFKPFRYVDQDKPAVRCSSNYLAFGLGR